MFSAIFTSNLLFIGTVRGMIIALIAMGIVLVYRSSRVINFAVGDLGVPATALLAIMVGIHHWPYWVALPAALAVGALSGTVVELAVIRRLFHAPRGTSCWWPPSGSPNWPRRSAAPFPTTRPGLSRPRSRAPSTASGTSAAESS